jgi:cobalt-zinc-cadmium efflux system outer membrane protein
MKVSRIALLLLAVPVLANAQERANGASNTTVEIHSPPARTDQGPAATPLAKLVEEAERNDPGILAAQQAVRAAAQMPAQASALPDPRFTLQHLSVGSPRPFAGYTNSDFAYIGFGASQEIPYAGKRRLRGEVAEREVDVLKQGVESFRRMEIEKLKEAYFRLGYLQQTLAILERNAVVVGQIAEAGEARYRSGQGNQQDIFKAQLQHTKILREISMNRQEAGEAQAELKRVLRRAQDSADIVAEPLAVTPLPLTTDELLARAGEQNPDVQQRAAMVRKGQSEVDLARREFRPDFGLSYMYQNTDRRFRDYYMFTFDVKLPRRKPRQAALAGAGINLERARQEQDAQLQESLAAVKKQIVAVQSSEERARIYREGLIPQARATFEAGMAAYQAGREDFETLISSVLDILDLDLDYQRTLLEHQLALARIERLTGAPLP